MKKYLATITSFLLLLMLTACEEKLPEANEENCSKVSVNIKGELHKNSIPKLEELGLKTEEQRNEFSKKCFAIQAEQLKKMFTK